MSMQKPTYEPTRVELKRNILVVGKSLWKGEQADVEKTTFLENGRIGSVRVTIRDTPLTLPRADFDIISRRRINNGQD